MAAALAAYPRPWHRAELEQRWSRRTLSEAQRTGLAVRIAPGQWVHREHLTNVACRLAAVVQWMQPHGAISGASALWMHGWAAAEVDRIDVVLPTHVRRSAPQCASVLRTDHEFETQFVDGIRVLSPEDAAILVWRRSAPGERTGQLLDILRDAPVDPAGLERRIGEHGRVPMRAALVEVAQLARTGVQSMLEHVAATQVFAGPEWAGWERQGEVTASGVALHPDMVHRDARIAVELDSRRHHSDDTARRSDLERDALLVAAGYSVVRLTWEDVTRRAEWCRARLRQALAARRG